MFTCVHSVYCVTGWQPSDDWIFNSSSFILEQGAWWWIMQWHAWKSGISLPDIKGLSVPLSFLSCWGTICRNWCKLLNVSVVCMFYQMFFNCCVYVFTSSGISKWQHCNSANSSSLNPSPTSNLVQTISCSVSVISHDSSIVRLKNDAFFKSWHICSNMDSIG